MSLSTMAAVIAGLMLSQAQDVAKPPKTEADEPRTVATISLANADATKVAKVLQEALGSDVGPIVAQPESNCVIFSKITGEQMKRVDDLLRVLDRPPIVIELDLRLLRLEGAVDLSQLSLQGKTSEVSSTIAKLLGEKRATDLGRVRLTSLNNQESFVQLGEDVPVARARSAFDPRVFNRSRGGAIAQQQQQESRRDPRFATSYANQSIGMLVKATSRILESRGVHSQISLEKSSLRQLATDDVPNTKTLKTTIDTSVVIPNGESVMVSAVDSDSAAVIAIVSATVRSR